MTYCRIMDVINFVMRLLRAGSGYRQVQYIILALIFIGSPFLMGCSEHDNSEEIQITREWANLAPLPEAADLKVETKGGSFSREFIVTFTAKSDDIKQWLGKSSGTKDLSPTKNDKGEWVYRIKPTSGAQFAEVTISADGLQVKIRAYWS